MTGTVRCPVPQAAVSGAPSRVHVREATHADNQALIDLAASSPMRGDLTLRMDRGPDFFALHRADGIQPRIGVVDYGQGPVGCVAAVTRRVYLNGREETTGYAGDLRVHPLRRDTETADALSGYAMQVCNALPSGTLTLIAVLAGNRSMERRLPGPRGLPSFVRIGTIRSHSIGILWKRKLRMSGGIRVRRAEWRDLDQMTALWRAIAPGRQFAPVMDTLRLAEIIAASPGLEISSYLLAHGRDGRLLGFAAVWDQSSMKRMYVDGYSRRLLLARTCFNGIAPLLGAEPMPPAGEPLRCRTVFHVCVPPEAPEVLRTLLVSAHNDLRHSRCSFMNIGLDTRDALSEAVRGLLAQPTDVNAYVTRQGAPPGAEALSALRSLPLHYEIALV